VPGGLEETWQEERFLRNLSETIAWCVGSFDRSDPKGSLRNFEPEYLHLDSQESQVFDVSLKRSNRLRSIGQGDTPKESGLGGGRLLAYFPDENLRHGLAELETNGFLDGDDIPPFDTWVWFERATETFEDGEARATSYLVAWVPSELIRSVDRSIEIDPAPCLAWLDRLDTPLVTSLKRLGVLGERVKNIENLGSCDAR
jgi:hypothetical protein